MPGGVNGTGAVDARSLHDLVADVVQRAIHDHDPATGTGPEGDDREDDVKRVCLHDLDEALFAEAFENEGDRADGGVKHEQPQHDARGARESAGDVEQESGRRGEPANAHRVHDEREKHHEDDEAREPDDDEERDVPDRRQEAVVGEDADEVVEADEGAVPGECEEQCVDGRTDAEGQKEQRVAARVVFCFWES